MSAGDVKSELDKKGWSMPHGMCNAIGMAGWLLNNGEHVSLRNYPDYYGSRDFVLEIEGVTVLGSHIKVTPAGASIISRSPAEPHDDLRRKLDLAQNWSSRSSGSRALGLLRRHGANFFIATEFTVHVREHPDTRGMVAVFHISRMESLFANLHKMMLSSNKTCWLSYAAQTDALRHLGPSDASPTPQDEVFWLICPESSHEAETAASFCQKVEKLTGERPDLCEVGGMSYDKVAEQEGLGWYPFFTFLFLPDPADAGDVVRWVVDQSQRVSLCRYTLGSSISLFRGRDLPWFTKEFEARTGLSSEEYALGAWIGLDLWFCDEASRKDDCLRSVREMQDNLALLVASKRWFRRTMDAHLPDCSIGERSLSNASWQHELYGSDYAQLKITRDMWDPHNQLSYFWGVGGDGRHPSTCSRQFSDGAEDKNCRAAQVAVDKMVKQKRAEFAAACPAPPQGQWKTWRSSCEV